MIMTLNTDGAPFRAYETLRPFRLPDKYGRSAFSKKLLAPLFDFRFADLQVQKLVPHRFSAS